MSCSSPRWLNMPKASAAMSPAVLRPRTPRSAAARITSAGVVAPDAGGVGLGAQVAPQAHVVDGGDADAELASHL
jgi:hypothetical protein